MRTYPEGFRNRVELGFREYGRESGRGKSFRIQSERF
jgi:hypothetical protein